MKVVGYTSLESTIADVSGAELLQLQNKFIKEYCRENGLELLYIFADNGSNNEFTAKNWLNLEDYIRVEPVTQVIALNPDRICKNIRARKEKELELADIGVRFIYLDVLSERDLSLC